MRSISTRTRTRTRTRTAALLAVAVLALTGCGRDSGDETGAEGQGEAVDDGLASGTIEVWAMGTEGEALQDFAAAFTEANPDAKVEVTAVPWDAAHDKIANAIAAGETPDVSLIGTTWMGEFAQAGGIEPMPEGLVDEADFFPGAWESTEVGGTSYGVPWYVETRALYYRTDLAEQAGWSQPPATWDELHQFASDLQTKGGADYGLQMQAGNTGAWQTMMPFAWSAGAELTDAEGADYTIDSPEMVEGLEYYSSFFADGLSSTDKLDPGELENGMANGTIGSFISGPWHADLVEEAGVSPDQYALAPLPGPDSAPGNSFVGGGDLAVFSDAENKDGAWKFIQWLSEPETQQAFYDEVGDLPAVQSAWDSGELADDPQLQVFGAQLEQASSPPAVPTWEEVAAVIDSEIEKVTKGQASAEEAVKAMQDQAASIGTGL